MAKNQQASTSKKGVSGAYERKEYVWFVFYIAFITISSYLAGMIGTATSVLVVAAVYKTFKNQIYSTDKKIMLSIFYFIGGMIIALVVINLSVAVISRFAGNHNLAFLNPEFRMAQNRSLSDQPFTNSATSESTTTGSTASKDSNPDLIGYSDSKYKFDISYPKGWTIDTSSTDATVKFENPQDNEVTLITVTAEFAKGHDLQAISKNTIQGFLSSESDSNTNLKVIAQGTTTLAGQPAYKFETTFDYVIDGQSFPFHAVSIVSKQADMSYIVFVSSFDKSWSKYQETFNTSIASFQFPE